MNILLASSEAVPFCKTGGLADVAGALAQVLARLGHRVALFLPRYRSVTGAGLPLEFLPGSFPVPIGDGAKRVRLARARWGPAEAYFVDCPVYFDRPGLYGEKGQDYADNDERFILFSRAVLEGAKFAGFKPDALHCHDWQTALIPAYLKFPYSIDAFYARAATVLTLHNIAYQGSFPKETLFLAGFGWSDFTPERLEFYGGFNFLKAGLVTSDILTTVSPTYAREIQAGPEFGRGMEGVLKHRSSDLHGVLNGIDVEAWNPGTDCALEKNYGPKDWTQGKAACKKSLRAQCGLQGQDGPLIGVVARLDPQKGLDLALEVLPAFLDARDGMQLAVLGTGEPALAEGYEKLALRFPGRAHFCGKFDETLAHRIYAGSDLFLMPSRFEPCGLGQMIAMRYGTLPVVTRTGGLADTVTDVSETSRPANGFVAAQATVEPLRKALETARQTFLERPAWSRLVKNAMGGDYSWRRSAQTYVELYSKAAGRKVV